MQGQRIWAADRSNRRGSHLREFWGNLLQINALPIKQLGAKARKGAGEELRGARGFLAEVEDADEALQL